MSSNSIKRLIGIDYLKVLGIYLMVLGHSPLLSDGLKSIIYSFHMPLFFMISGLFFKNQDIKGIIRKSFNSLLIPYFLINLINLSLWIFTQYLHGDLHFSDFTARFYAILLGLGYERFGLIPVCAPTWFFLALFWCRIFMNLYCKYCKNLWSKVLVVVLIIVLVRCMKATNIIIPYAITSALMALPIVIFAYELKDTILGQNNRLNIFCTVLVLLIISLVSYISNNDGTRCDIDAVWYSRSLLLFYVSAISTCLLLIISFKNITYNSAFINYISTGTIVIVGFHLTVAYYLYKFDILYYLPNQLSAFVISLIIIILLYPIILLSNKYFPAILGKYRT